MESDTQSRREGFNDQTLTLPPPSFRLYSYCACAGGKERPLYGSLIIEMPLSLTLEDSGSLRSLLAVNFRELVLLVLNPPQKIPVSFATLRGCLESMTFIKSQPFSARPQCLAVSSGNASHNAPALPAPTRRRGHARWCFVCAETSVERPTWCSHSGGDFLWRIWGNKKGSGTLSLCASYLSAPRLPHQAFPSSRQRAL